MQTVRFPPTVIFPLDWTCLALLAFLTGLSVSCCLPHPLACFPSSLQTVFLKTLHPSMNATPHNHSQKDRGRNDLQVLRISGGGLLRERHILSLLSWRILDTPCSKGPRATFVQRLPSRTHTPHPGNGTLASATPHSGSCAVYLVFPFVQFAAIVWLQLLLLRFWLGSYTTPLAVQTGHLTNSCSNSTKQSLVLFFFSSVFTFLSTHFKAVITYLS